MLKAGRKCRFLKVYDHRFIADRAAICTDPMGPVRVTAFIPFKARSRRCGIMKSPRSKNNSAGCGCFAAGRRRPTGSDENEVPFSPVACRLPFDSYAAS